MASLPEHAQVLLLRTGSRAETGFLFFEFRGLSSAPKSSALKTWRISTSAPPSKSALQRLDRFVHGAHLPKPEARDEFVGLGEWAVDNAALGSGARRIRRRVIDIAGLQAANRRRWRPALSAALFRKRWRRVRAYPESRARGPARRRRSGGTGGVAG